MRGILVAVVMIGALAVASAASAAQLSGAPDRYVFVSGADDDEVDVDESDPGLFTIFTSPEAIDLDTGAAAKCTGGGTDTVECGRPPDHLRINLDGGDDDVTIDDLLPMTFTIDGGAGVDTLGGGALRDTITGGPGPDHVIAGDGDDAVFVRDGDVDEVDCGDGADTVQADPVDVLTDCEGVSLPPQSPPPPPPAAAARCVVPALRGKTLARARVLLAARHCRLGRVGRSYSRVRRGRVVAQAKRPGAHLPQGTKVGVVVSRGRRR
jgi:Ca2+-binding RTX toxin-like protein